jgi:hypothetical protein
MPKRIRAYQFVLLNFAGRNPLLLLVMVWADYEALKLEY